MRILASLLGGSHSSSRLFRRDRPSPAHVRSTTPRRGRFPNPFDPGGRLTTAILDPALDLTTQPWR